MRGDEDGLRYELTREPTGPLSGAAPVTRGGTGRSREIVRSRA
jgi:hypothetical protein